MARCRSQGRAWQSALSEPQRRRIALPKVWQIQALPWAAFAHDRSHHERAKSDSESAQTNRCSSQNDGPREPGSLSQSRSQRCGHRSTRLLGKHLFVIGTNALYAYEMKAGVLFESSLLATSDFDLLWGARGRLRLLVTGVSPEGVLGVLKKADPTYATADNYGVRAQNANSYLAPGPDLNFDDKQTGV